MTSNLLNLKFTTYSYFSRDSDRLHICSIYYGKFAKLVVWCTRIRGDYLSHLFTKRFFCLNSPSSNSDKTFFKETIPSGSRLKNPPKFDLVSSLDMLWTSKGETTRDRGNKKLSNVALRKVDT